MFIVAIISVALMDFEDGVKLGQGTIYECHDWQIIPPEEKIYCNNNIVCDRWQNYTLRQLDNGIWKINVYCVEVLFRNSLEL